MAMGYLTVTLVSILHSKAIMNLRASSACDTSVDPSPSSTVSEACWFGHGTFADRRMCAYYVP